MTTTSGKGPRRVTREWAAQVADLLDMCDVHVVSEVRAAQPGQPAILRCRARAGHDAPSESVDETAGAPVGGTAILTLYATGSWTWGGDADVIAYVREPLDRHGVLPCTR